MDKCCTPAQDEKSLKIAIVITTSLFAIELVGGFLSGSISLIGDAVHMLRDVAALIISFGAIRIAQHLPEKGTTFGFHRMEIFAAFINGIASIVFAVWMVWESIQRIGTPQPVESTLMLYIALIGLVANVYVMARLWKSADLNVKSARLCVIADTVSSIGVVAAAIFISSTGNTIIDPIMGLAIAGMVIYFAVGIVNESVRIILEFAPKGIALEDIISEMKKVKGVEGVHNVHFWTLCSHINVLDAHIYTKEEKMKKLDSIKAKLREKLKKFEVKHSTFEFEAEECIDCKPTKQIHH